MSKNTIIIGAALISAAIVFESVLRHKDTKELKRKLENLEIELMRK